MNLIKEIKSHIPFTMFGAATGIIAMLIFKNFSSGINLKLFAVFHPAHVLLSAMVTTSLYLKYAKKKNILILLIVGYFGSVGIATISDCIIPFFGETFLNVSIPSHSQSHEPNSNVSIPSHTQTHEPNSNVSIPSHSQSHDHNKANEQAGEDCAQHNHANQDHNHKSKLHLGFIEHWYLVNPAAILGIFIAFLRPETKLSHSAHVLISTWASSFHVLANLNSPITLAIMLGIFVVLFIAVWVPCCLSDIIFPLLIVRDKSKITSHH